ncbi:MAG: BON domain-containing protein [Gemmatimonadaceae bacterium]
MKTNSQLQGDVVAELRWEPKIEEANIATAVHDGIVTLSGHVSTFAQKLAAERAAERVAGVKAIANELDVRILGINERTDTDIAQAALTALHWDVEVPDRITVKVDKGYVTLDGTVDWFFQKAAAQRAVRNLTGVRGVWNNIALKPRVAEKDVTRRIKEALHRSADREADRITVDAADGRVTLRGSVRSYAERKDMEMAAWAAPGVAEVTDLTSISSI